MVSYLVFLWLSVFIATTVEMIEALTIILALGLTRGWRSVLLATGAALVSLAVIVAVFNQALSYINDESQLPIGSLWAVVGALLLIFGLQWTKKSILRMAGVLKSRNEDEIYEKTAKAAKRAGRNKQTIDWYSFVLAYKGVLLEGFEVIFIVVIFGATRGQLGLGISAAATSLVFVALLGFVLHKPLSRVPENLMKITVGLLLTTFGTFFGSEGLKIVWPFGDWALLYLFVLYAGFAYICVQLLRSRNGAKPSKVVL